MGAYFHTWPICTFGPGLQDGTTIIDENLSSIIVVQLRRAEDAGDIDFDWDIVPMPHPKGVSPNTTWGMPDTISIHADSDKKDAAWEYLKFRTGPEGAKISASLGTLPAFYNREIEEVFLSGGNGIPENLAIIPQANVYVEFPAVPGINTIVNTIYKEEMELMFVGDQTPEQTISNIKKRIEEEM